MGRPAENLSVAGEQHLRKEAVIFENKQ